MIRFFRSKKNSMIMYIMMGGALLSMAFFGLFDMNVGQVGGTLAKVGSETISAIEFDRAFKQQEAYYQRIFGKNYGDSHRKMLTNMVQENLIYGLVQKMEASRMGIGVSEMEVKDSIKEITAFQNDGVFDYNRFTDYLKSWRWSENGFVQKVTNDLQTQKLESIVQNGFYVSENEAFVNYRLDKEKVKVAYVQINPDVLPFKAKNEDVETMLKTGEKQIKEYYETHAKNYNQEKRVKASHILISYAGAQRAAKTIVRTKVEAQKKAEAVLLEVQGAKTTFAEIAKKQTDEESGKGKGGDLGYFEYKSMAKPFAEAAFKMKVGEVSSVVESPFGFHIIKVTALKEAVNRKLEDVQREVAEKVIFDQKKDNLAHALGEKLIKELKDKKNIDEILKENKLILSETGFFGLNDSYIAGIGASDKFMLAAFKLSEKNLINSTPLRNNGQYFVLQFLKREQVDVLAFREERVTLMNRLKSERTMEISRAYRTILMDRYRDEITYFAKM